MTQPLLKRILVPVANEDDAYTTCHGIKNHLDGCTELHAIHIIKKGGGAPDKAPIDLRREQAEALFEILETELADTACELSTELRYGTNVLTEIIAAAEENDATAIAFTPRSSGRITKVLTGNKTQKLVSKNHVPVIVLPTDSEQG
ncbi:universal stress protein [Natronolimnobius sp. AArcel1]|uniref:universal stress protein n=1 Tax=Natronolimnobius sp. AArcel1 TaxID=1679093 RepID=UPI0013ECF19F|nr:universal stress protein [Natronolimnobius sp. AArcel1]NGM70569.1 universal stress protein [Natronolimnobius sp. AArcel1]